LDLFKDGSILEEDDDNFTTSHYSEKIFPKPRMVAINSIVTDEIIRTESSTELNFKKIFEQCNVEWLQNLQK
jgi:hypothetical protein